MWDDCPWCGSGLLRLEQVDLTDTPNVSKWAIECVNCGARGPVVQSHAAFADLEAGRAWNERYAPPPELNPATKEKWT